MQPQMQSRKAEKFTIPRDFYVQKFNLEGKLKMKTKTKIYAIIATIMTACYAVLIALSVWNLGVQMKINALKSDGRNVMYTDAAAFAEVCDEINHLKTLKAWN